jgi:hypothetical protein
LYAAEIDLSINGLREIFLRPAAPRRRQQREPYRVQAPGVDRLMQDVALTRPPAGTGWGTRDRRR